MLTSERGERMWVTGISEFQQIICSANNIDSGIISNGKYKLKVHLNVNNKSEKLSVRITGVLGAECGAHIGVRFWARFMININTSFIAGARHCCVCINCSPGPLY